MEWNEAHISEYRRFGVLPNLSFFNEGAFRSKGGACVDRIILGKAFLQHLAASMFRLDVVKGFSIR